MGGMFRSTEPAQFSLDFPTSVAGSGSQDLFYFQQNAANLRLDVSDNTGYAIVYALLSALPAGCTAFPTGYGYTVLVNQSLIGAVGLTRANLSSETGGVRDASFTVESDSCQWGGTVDLLCQGAEDAALARKALLNQWVPNSSTVPTALTLNDDGGGPLLTRTIGNASATAVSPDQVLRLGKAV